MASIDPVDLAGRQFNIVELLRTTKNPRCRKSMRVMMLLHEFVAQNYCDSKLVPEPESINRLKPAWLLGSAFSVSENAPKTAPKKILIKGVSLCWFLLSPDPDCGWKALCIITIAEGAVEYGRKHRRQDRFKTSPRPEVRK